MSSPDAITAFGYFVLGFFRRPAVIGVDLAAPGTDRTVFFVPHAAREHDPETVAQMETLRSELNLLLAKGDHHG